MLLPGEVVTMIIGRGYRVADGRITVRAPNGNTVLTRHVPVPETGIHSESIELNVAYRADPLIVPNDAPRRAHVACSEGQPRSGTLTTSPEAGRSRSARARVTSTSTDH